MSAERIFIFHYNAIAMKPGLFKKTFSINENYKTFLDKVKPFFSFSISKNFARGNYKN